MRALRESGHHVPGNRTLREFAAALLELPHIAAHIEERRAAAMLTISEHNVVAEVAKIAFFNASKLLVIQDDGSAYVDLTNLEQADGAAIREIVSEVYTDNADPDGPRDVKRTTIKVEPKTPALQFLGRYLGMLDADNAPVVNINMGDPTRIVEARRRARAATNHGKQIELKRAG